MHKKLTLTHIHAPSPQTPPPARSLRRRLPVVRTALTLPPGGPRFFCLFFPSFTFSLLLLAFLRSRLSSRTPLNAPRSLTLTSHSHAYSHALSTDASTSTITQAEAPGGAYGLDTSPTARRSSDPACVCRDRHKIFELRAQKNGRCLTGRLMGKEWEMNARTRALSNT